MRKTFMGFVAAFVLVVSIAAAPASAITLWGLDTGPNTLVTIDTDTGAVTTIGSLPTFSFGGLDFASDGTLYALLDDDLYTVDPGDATSVLVGTAGGRAFESFQILGGVGYSADVLAEDIYSVDLSDGSATLVGNHGSDGAADERITGMASDDGATLVGTQLFLDRLERFSAVDGSSMGVIGVHGVDALTSLAFGDGLFWAITTSNSDLYSLDPTDASATLVFGGLALDHITGLTARDAVAVPEPTTAALALLGLGGLMARRNRKAA